MPRCPWATAFSIAATWPETSVSFLPAARVKVTPLASAARWAPSAIATKNGSVKFFVMSERLNAEVATDAPTAGAFELSVEDAEELAPQAVNVIESAQTVAIAA
jgi:hypothetical protein